MSKLNHPIRLAIVLSHPTQYYSPWFRDISGNSGFDLKVFYLWNFGASETTDRKFGESFRWDVPLLEGYESEFLPNQSDDPGTHHFGGLNNPGVAKAIADWRPDALLIFGYKYATHLRLLFSPRLWKIPFFFRGDSHELVPSRGWKSRIGRLVRTILFQRFRCFLAVGQANRQYFRNSGVPERKIQFVPHCVDNDRFQNAAANARTEAVAWKSEIGIPSEALVVLFAGKFEEKKRPQDLLEAFLAIRESLPAPTVLLFVGGGQLETELRRIAASSLDQSVFFVSFQNQRAMPKVYASGDLLALTSRGRGETWGLAVNEAMNLGIPALLSDQVGCAADLVVPGETGWTFASGDRRALETTLIEALSDRDGLTRRGRKARLHIEQYSYAVATRRLVDCVTPLIRK